MSLLRYEFEHWKAASFIFAENTFERFGRYGLRAILLLYLRDMLDFDRDKSTMLYHLFIMLTNLWPLVFAVIADSGLGRYRMISILLSFYVLGILLSSLGAMPGILLL